MSTFGTWFPYRRSGIELFAFPHAGAGSSAFNNLRELLKPDGIAVSGAVLPGRGRRLREPPHRRIEPVLRELGKAFVQDEYSAFQGEYALLGHCSGSLIAYEVARLLVSASCRNPSLLVVCSCLPPQLIFDTGVGRLPTRALIQQTAAMGGTPKEVLDDPDFRAVLERPLRADWELFDAYAPTPGAAPLPVPVLGVRGTDDPNCEARFLEQWRPLTSASFRTVELSSGHWALDGDGAVELAAAIRTQLPVAQRS